MLSTFRRTFSSSSNVVSSKVNWTRKDVRHFASEINKVDIVSERIDPNIKLERVVSTDRYFGQQRPLVLLLSWLAAKQQHISKFSDIYLRSGCDVLTVNIRPVQILLPTIGAQIIAKNVVDIIQNEEFRQRPILVHGFSTGGYMYSEILQKIFVAESSKGEICNRIIAQIYDSVADINSIPSGISRAVFKRGVVQKTVETSIKNYMKIMHKPATQHHLRGSKVFHLNPVLAPTLFFYSQTDPIGNPTDNERVMNSLKKNVGHQEVYSKIFEDSPHVSHMYRHPDEYLATLKWFLEKLEYFRGRFELEQSGHIVRVKE